MDFFNVVIILIYIISERTGIKMAAEPPVGHPCHQLSNPSARMFWCRHCMTGFPDPMQRWRHSKECKAISSHKKYGGHNPPNQHTGMLPLFPKYDSPTPSPQSDASTPNKKKKSVDLKCYICKKEFITINEMRDHVKRPCNKPEIKNTLKDTYDSLILTNEEDSDDSVSQNEDKVTNQIETLLKAAQILQQKKDQLMATSKQTTKTTILGHRRISENIDMEDSPYVSNTEDMVFDVVNKRPYDNKVYNFCRFLVYCVPFVKHLGSLSVTLFSLVIIIFSWS